MRNRHLIDGAHVPRELFKGTGTNDGKVVPPESLGIWYVPLIWGFNEMNQLAKAMGGDQWKIMPKSFTRDQFRWYSTYGAYAIDGTTEPEKRWSWKKSESSKYIGDDDSAESRFWLSSQCAGGQCGQVA